MFYSLRGTLLHFDQHSLAIECGGVGYLCQTTLSTLSKLSGVDSEVFVYTYMHMRQDNMDLFAFADKSELNCFKMLINITGVGPKVGLSILSALSPERVALSVAGGDYKALTQASGVGAKLAQRIVLELRDKVSKLDATKGATQSPANFNFGSGNASEAISALVVLGFSHTDAVSVISTMDTALAVEEMIKIGLKTLSQQ